MTTQEILDLIDKEIEKTKTELDERVVFFGAVDHPAVMYTNGRLGGLCSVWLKIHDAAEGSDVA